MESQNHPKPTIFVTSAVGPRHVGRDKKGGGGRFGWETPVFWPLAIDLPLFSPRSARCVVAVSLDQAF